MQGKQFFLRDKKGNITDNIIPTKDLVSTTFDAEPGSRVSTVGLSLIQIKAIRSQTKAIKISNISTIILAIVGFLLTITIAITEIKPIKTSIENFFTN